MDHCYGKYQSLPAYFLLYGEKRAPEKAKVVLSTFWKALKKKAVLLVLYTMVNSITFNVYVAALCLARFYECFENFVLAGLTLIRRFGLSWSWRKMIWAGTILVAVFNLLYLLIAFDILRNPWFYIFTDVTDNFQQQSFFSTRQLSLL